MQQVAYSGYPGPQQIPQITMEPTAFFADSVIPMIPGWEHSQWLVVRDDFRVITNQTGAAEVLRVFERLANRRKAKLRREHGIPEDYLPHDDDMRIPMSFGDICEGIMEFWAKPTCWQAVKHLKELGFLQQFVIARKTAAVVDQPLTTIYEDDTGFYIFVDREGFYTDINGKEHDAKDEGYDIEWQYLLCFDAIRAAIAKAAWREAPEPAKRWPPIVKRRDPILPQGTGEEASSDQEQTSVAANDTTEFTSPDDAKDLGTCCPPSGDASLTIQDSTGDEVGQEILTNFPETSAIPGNSQPAAPPESFSNAPWCPETLIGLAGSRHTQGLFEITGDDVDYDGAESLDRRRQTLGLDPTAFWPILDQHIAAMMDPASETWYATKRDGDNLCFNLTHVANNWKAVETTLVKKPWWPLSSVPYYGPLRDYAEPRRPTILPPGASIFGDIEETPVPQEAPVQDSEAQDSEVSFDDYMLRPRVPKPPGEAKKRPLQRDHGMIYGYAENLIEQLKPVYPGMSLRLAHDHARLYFVRVGYAPGCFFNLTEADEGKAKRLIDQALADYTAEQTLQNTEIGEMHGDHSEGEEKHPPQEDGTRHRDDT